MKTKTIINITQHTATAEQVAAGVVDLPPETAAKVRSLLTFEEVPDEIEMVRRARAITDIVRSELERLRADGHYVLAVMIGGAPWFMALLERELCRLPIQHRLLPVYAFSRREAVEEQMPDGSVRKSTVFRHAGFIPAWWVNGSRLPLMRWQRANEAV